MSIAIQGKLPDDFPGRAALEAADITTYAGVRNAGDLKEIPNIGDATAKSIQDAMDAAQTAHDQESDDENATGADPATAPQTDQNIATDTSPGSAVPADVMPPGGLFISPDTRITAAISNIEDQVRAVKSRTNDQGQVDQDALALVADGLEEAARELHDKLSKEKVFESPVDFAFKVATPAPKRLEVHAEKDVPVPGSAARFPYMGVVGEPS